MKRRKRRAPGSLLVLALMLLSPALHVSGQFGGTYKGFKLLDYYDEPAPGKGTSRALKSQITGGEAQTANGVERITKGVRIENYLQDGATNLTATAPDCFVDLKTRTAYSASPLQVQTAHGQLTIQGQGFFYQQTNFNLIISNQIETAINRELIHSSNALASAFPFRTGTNAPAGSNSLIKIFSDNFSMESSSNLAVYTGSVRVDDPQIEMVCEVLTLRRSSNGPIERIEATRNVALTNKQDQSVATGDKAVYSLESEQEQVVLTGSQAHWQDREREARAGVFTLDRRSNILRAEDKPWMRWPGSTISQPDWMAGGNIPPSNAPPSTNQFVEITAEEMLLHLPTTNQPSRRVTARNHVILINRADNSRATADQIVYDDASAVAELGGHAVWESDQRLVKGETLIFDRMNKVFTARGNAYFKAPLSSLSRTTPFPTDPHKPLILETIEVFSDDWTYQPAALAFKENVRANYLQGDVRRAGLTCGFLSVGFNSNRLENLRARKRVALDQPWTGTNDAQRVERRLNCEDLRVQFYTNGLIQSIFAQTNVLAQQDETRPGHAGPIHSELGGTTATAYFFAHTNQIREIVAEQNVAILREDKKAHGERAVYVASRREVELTGHPTAEMPMGRITHAEVLIWDEAHNTLRATATGTNVVARGEAPHKWGANRIGPVFPRLKSNER